MSTSRGPVDDERTHNLALEPSARTYRWRAAAQRERYTDRIRRNTDHSSSGLLRLLDVHRGGSLLRTVSVSRGRGTRSGVSISGAATDQEQDQLAAAAIGVIRVRWAFSSSQPGLSIGGGRPCRVGQRRFLYRFTAGGQAVASDRAGHRVAVNVLGGHGAVDVAPLWGLFEAPVPSRALLLGEGSFAGPYNTRWSRRAR
jgi:hypothetical protein